MNPAALRRIVHDKLQRGLLPPTTPLHESTSIEPGRTAPRACAACEAHLAAGETVHELHTGGQTLALHAACHAAWRAERIAALAHALERPDAGDPAGSPAHAATDILYVVDAADALVSCSRHSWRRFAVVNDGGDVAEPDRLLQRSLFHFISGEPTRRLYRSIHRQLRRHPGTSVVLTGRCDGPTVRRSWRVSIAAVVEADRVVGILYRSTILGEIARPEVRLLRRDRPSPGPDTIAVCSLCLRVRPSATRRWAELERYAGAHPDGTEIVTEHTVCPWCERNAITPALRAS